MPWKPLSPKKLADALLLILFPIAATILVGAFRLNFLVSTLLFFGVPSVYLSIKKPGLVKKTFIFTLIFATAIIFIFDYPAYIDQTWFVPNSVFRFLGNSISIEDVLWTYLWVYFAIIFWEYFLDFGKAKDRFSKNLRYLIIFLSLLLTGFFLLYFINNDVLYIPYFYLKAGVVLVILPLTIVLLKFPRLIRKVFIIGLYFFVVSLLHEYVGLRNNHWYFGGIHYLGTTIFAGQLIPYDEIIFWWALGVPGIICWYEFFADNQR